MVFRFESLPTFDSSWASRFFWSTILFVPLFLSKLSSASGACDKPFSKTYTYSSVFNFKRPSAKEAIRGALICSSAAVSWFFLTQTPRGTYIFGDLGVQVEQCGNTRNDLSNSISGQNKLTHKLYNLLSKVHRNFLELIKKVVVGQAFRMPKDRIYVASGKCRVVYLDVVGQQVLVVGVIFFSWGLVDSEATDRAVYGVFSGACCDV